MESVQSKVDEWMDAGDVGSVVSEFVGRAESAFGDFDDSQYRVVEDEVPVVRAAETAVSDVAVALEAVAVGAQRKAVCGFYRQYSRGRMFDNPDYAVRATVPQRLFRLEGFMQLGSIDDPALVQALMAGPVRTRLGAATGMGKTMKLPGLLALKCGIRVLQLELDDDVASTALKFQKKKYGIAGGARAWCREKKAYLTVMSYHEFRGVVLSGDRDRLFEDFDLFYMDEAHDPEDPVFAAKQYFAAFARPHNSLLVVSATVSTMADNNEVATGVGRFKVEPAHMSLNEAMDSGRLVDEALHDRTQVLVATDEDAAKLRAYYDENGADTWLLDRASTKADREAVVAAFSVPTAVTPRVLVTTENFGTSYNIPLSFVITTCTRSVYEFDASNALVQKEIPLMRKNVVQHQGRVGRGLAVGSGGWCLSPAVSADHELLVSCGLSAYLSLVAATIAPRPGLFNSVTKVLPKGIDHAVARMLLRSSLPSGAIVRYLGSDGRFASRFIEGVRMFHQTGEALRPSKDEYPVGYEDWIEETVGEYYEGDDTVTSTTLRVPFKCPPGLKIQMHAISAVAEGCLKLEYWDYFYEDEESDDEEIGVRTKAKRKVQPRLPQAPAPKVVSETVGSVEHAWQYGADPANANVKRARRKGMSWAANGEGKTAITTLMRALENSRLGTSVAVPGRDAKEYAGKVAYTLPLDDEAMVAVKSAGGGKILLVTERVHEAFMSGKALSSVGAREVLQHLVEIRAVERFAKSTLFDNWSPAWLSWFGTFGDSTVFAELKRCGMHSDAVKLLGYLYDRFRSEVLSVAVSSHLYSDKLGGWFRLRPSITKFVSAARKGKLPVAQSDAFVARVLLVKDAYDMAILSIEESGVFAPGLVTGAQRRLPIRDRHREMPVIDEDVVERDPAAKLVMDSGRSWRR